VALTLRNVVNRPLTNQEVDDNFTYLEERATILGASYSGEIVESEQGFSSVAVSGNYAVVSGSTIDASVAYILDAKTHSVIHTLNRPDSVEYFGYHVAISGSTAAVSAANVNSPDSGTVYLFDVITGELKNTIRQTTYGIDASSFGKQVALTGDYLVVAANRTDSTSAVYVFDVNTSQLLYTFSSPNPYNSTDSIFGDSLSASNNKLIVGSYREGTIEYMGRAYMYDLESGQLIHTFETPSYEGGTNLFAASVAICDNYAIISHQGQNKAYVYNVTTRDLVHTIDSIVGTINDVAISENYALVRDYPTKVDIYDIVTGSHVYTLDNTQAVYVDPEVTHYFGASPSISGNRVLLLDQFNESTSRLYNFQLSASSYVPSADEFKSLVTSISGTSGSTNAASVFEAKLVKTLAPEFGENFGTTIESSNRYYTAVCNQYEVAAGVDAAGAVYVYDVVTGDLVRRFESPAPYPFGQFGDKIAITDDTIAIYEIGAGGNSSKIYIYDIKSGDLKFTADAWTLITNLSDLALTDNYLVVSTTYNMSTQDGVSWGFARVYSLEDLSYVRLILNPDLGDEGRGPFTVLNFGAKLQATNDRLYMPVVATGDVDGEDLSGRLHVFNINDGSLIQTLVNPGGPDGIKTDDRFATIFHSNGKYLVVGSQEPVNAYKDGLLYVYDDSTFELLYTITNPNNYGTGEYDYFATTNIKVTDRFVVAGAAYEDSPGIDNSGIIYIFDVENGDYIGKIENPNLDDNDWAGYFGNNMAIAGDYITVSDYTNDSSTGVVFIYRLTTPMSGLIDDELPTLHGDLELKGHSIVHNGPYGNFEISASDLGTDQLLRLKVNDETFIRLRGVDGVGGDYPFGGNGESISLNKRTVITGFSYPQSGTVGQVMTLSSTGNITFEDAPVSYTDSDVASYLSTNGYDTATNIIASITDSAPEALDTLNELAAALGDDADFSTTVTNSIASKIGSVVEDTTPQLGGDLDVNNKNIISSDKSVSSQYLVYGNSIRIQTGDIYNSNTSGSAISGNLILETGDSTVAGDGDANRGAIVLRGDNNYVYGATTFSADYQYDRTNSGEIRLAENPEAGNTYIALKAPGSIISNTTFVLPATDGAEGHAIVTDGAGNLSFADLTPFAASLFHTLDNPNAYGTSSIDQFGESVAISGNYAIVGAQYEDDSGGTSSGKAYIFNVTTGALLHTLDNPNPIGTSENDFFGVVVAISGNYAIVSAYQEDDAGGNTSGKAYIFNVTTGALVHTLDNPNAYSTSFEDGFGASVALSGNYAIVGAPGEDDAGGNTSGKAYIFNVTTGALLHTLDNPNAYAISYRDSFGSSVAISGNYAIVSAYQEDEAGGISSGKAYIFDVTTGVLLHTLDNPNAYDTTAYDAFGNSVSISGNYAIIGARNEDDAGGPASGKAYIFDVTTGTLLRTLDNPNAYSTSQADYFGTSVSISGDYAIVGAYAEDDAGGTESGKAYIFDVVTGSLLYTLDNPNTYLTSAYDRFARRVTISGNYAIVSAYQEDEDGVFQSGKAYIYQLSAPAYAPTADEFNSLAIGALQGELDNKLGNIAEDTTPQLSANLDTNNFSVGASDKIDNWNGNVYGKNLALYAGDAVNEDTSTGSAYGGQVYIYSGTGTIGEGSTGTSADGFVSIEGIKYPRVDGSTGQVMTTDGSGQLSFSTRLANVVEDTTPQLGGDLDANSYGIIGSGLTGLAIKSDSETPLLFIYGDTGGEGSPDTSNIFAASGRDFVLSAAGDSRLSISSTNGAITFNPNTGGYTFPLSDGTSGQVLSTDGSGNLSFSTFEVASDTTPELSGSLDANSNSITNVNRIEFGTATTKVGDIRTITATSELAQTFDVAVFPQSDYRSLKVMIQGKNTGTGDYYISELLCFHDGTDAYSTEYATMYTSEEPDFEVVPVLNNGNFIVRITPATDHTIEYKFVVQAITS
jgi:outer membrane protein assembly factor BamB